MTKHLYKFLKEKDGKPFLDQDLYKWIWENRAPELNPSLLELTNSEGKDG